MYIPNVDPDDIAPEMAAPPPVMDGPATPSAMPADKPGWQSFDMPISRSGWATDRRGFHPDFMGQLAVNTCIMVAEAGLKSPIRFSHPDMCDRNDEPPTGGGVLRKCWTVPATDNPKDVILMGTVDLWGDLLESQLAGTSPQRSIGFRHDGMTTGGRLVGWYVDHLAFLPAHGAGFPGLDEQVGELAALKGKPDRHWAAKALGALGTVVKRVEELFRRTSNLAANPSGDRSNPQELRMNPEECAQLIDMGAFLTALGNKYMEGGEDPEGEDKPEEDQPPESAGALRAKAERDVLLADARERAFAGLVKDGHAKPDQRKQFDALAAAGGKGPQGIREAEKFFLGLSPFKAPSGVLPEGTTDPTLHQEEERKAVLRAAFGPMFDTTGGK